MVLTGRPEGNGPHGSTKRLYDYDIKINLTNIVWESVG